MLVQQQQRGQGLVLCGARYVFLFHRKMGQEAVEVGCDKPAGMGAGAEERQPTDPKNTRFFGAAAVMPGPQDLYQTGRKASAPPGQGTTPSRGCAVQSFIAARLPEIMALATGTPSIRPPLNLRVKQFSGIPAS